MKNDRHWPIVNSRGEVVAPACKLRPSIRLDELPMAVRPDDVTCRRCLSSDRYKAVVEELEQREADRRAAREQRVTAMLLERHRAEFEELLAAEAVLDALEG